MDRIFWSESLMGRNQFVDVDVDGKTILKSILKKGNVGFWIGLNYLKTGSSNMLL
jgi:hypothetical protein